MAPPVTAANFSISGWGSGASVTAVSGDQTRCRLTVTAGTGPTVSPSVTFTFPAGGYPVLPLSMAWMVGGTGMVSDISNTANNTSATYVYTDLPLAGRTYILMLDTLGV